MPVRKYSPHSLGQMRKEIEPRSLWPTEGQQWHDPTSLPPSTSTEYGICLSTASHNYHIKVIKGNSSRDFPGGPVVENPPANAGDMGSIPGRGTKIPHAVGQLSPCTTTREPARCNYWAHAL